MPDTSAVETAAQIDASIPEHLKTPPTIETKVELTISLDRETVDRFRGMGHETAQAAFAQVLRQAAEYLRTLPEDKCETLSENSAFEAKYLLDQDDLTGSTPVDSEEVEDFRIQMMGIS
tara:strand:- start:5727 stop:6083 length:357 start_codon:yes stop_codon:yes gene_type:complete